MGQTEARAREKELALRELREEIEEKMMSQLPAELRESRQSGKNQKFEEWEIATKEEAKRVIEAILFVATKPLTAAEIKRVLKGFGGAKIEEIIRELREEYEREGRSFRVSEVAGGFEVSTESKYAPWIMKLELQKKAKQATQSALETLAILAYKQPLTRAEIEDLRGVDVSGVLSTLLERNLVKVVGRKEVPGRPFLYGTTDKFLEHFGLKSITELPDISEIKALIENSIRKEDLLVRTDAPQIEVSKTNEESNIQNEGQKETTA